MTYGALRNLPALRSVWPAATAAAVLHLAFVGAPLGTDEGGFALIARHWSEPGPNLYGPLWVDRPPVLLVVFAAAVAVGPHVVAALCSVVLVIATAASARAVGGASAATWSAWAAAAFSSSAFLSAQQLNGELAAAAVVAVAIALLVVRPRVDTACVAGAAAVAALLIKQDFVDGIVFGIVLLVLGLQEVVNRRTEIVRAMAFIAGGLAAAGATLVWAGRHGGARALGYAMYGFRLDALRVQARPVDSGTDAVRGIAFAAASGVLLALVALAWHAVRRPKSLSPLGLALAAAIAFELVGIGLGGSWWPHYFIALAPTVALAAGVVSGRLVRAAIVISVASALIATPVYAVQVRVTTSPDRSVADFLRGNAMPADSGFVAFTHVNVLEMARVKPAYPYDWSLPIRVRDPHLDLLVSTLESASAPTWVIQWDPANSWGVDPQGRVQALLGERYHQVATICGHEVWLLNAAAPRSIAAPVRAC